MTEDIRDYVQCCEKCQRMNAKFMKSNATLHPIPAEPKVWRQVRYIYDNIVAQYT